MYAINSFPILGRDEGPPREYRTGHPIPKIYDEIAEAIATVQPYQTRLDPPPATSAASE